MNASIASVSRAARCVVESLESRTLMAFGQLQTDFGTNGIAITPFTNASHTPIIQDIELSGGKIVAAGSGGIARYTSSGDPDTSFNTTGHVNLPSVNFKDMAVDSSGRVYVLATGSAGTLIIRYTSSGALDSGYAQGGTALVTNNAGFTAQKLAIQSDDKVVIAGVFTTDQGNSTKARVYRLNTSGTGDTSFGSGAILNVQLGTSNLLTPTLQDAVTGLDVLSSGKIQLTGGSRAYSPSFYNENTGEYFEATYGDTMFVSARITTAGALDSAYGSGGIARATYATGVYVNLPSASAVLSDGSAAVSVNSSESNANRLVVGEFGAGGAVVFNQAADPGYEFGTPVDMAAKSDGRFFILGYNGQRGGGMQITQVTTGGVFSNVVYTDDTDPDTVDISQNGLGGIAIADDGNLLVGGVAEQSAGAFELIKMDEGALNAPRPDEFVNARANDIVRDSGGGIHVAYFDAAAKVLKYAYRAPNGLWSSPVTVDATENAGQYVSIGTDSSGAPGIAYFEGTEGNFKYAYLVGGPGGTWKTETVESKGSVGLYPSLKFDNTGRPTVIYFNKTKGDCRFAVRNQTTNTWSFENVQTADNVGRSGDLQVDPNTNRFACTYTDSTTNQVNYATHQKGGIWTVVKAADTKGGADFLSLSYTYYGRKAAIAYYDAYAADLKLTTLNSSGSGFTTRLLVSKGAVGLYNTLTYDYNGAHIYTYDKSNDQALLVNDSPNGTAATAIVKNAGKYLSVFSDTNAADMSFYDAAAGVLKVRGGPTI